VGNVQVVGCFEIMPGGQFRGEFKVGELKVHPGAVCEGKGKVLGLVDGVAQLPEVPPRHRDVLLTDRSRR
jgi:hypothetical protein